MTGDPTMPDSGSGAGPGPGPGPGVCFTVFDSERGCDLYSSDTCRYGDCRPYGDTGELSDISCVEQTSSAGRLLFGESCQHHCAGVLGADDCLPGSICDPFAQFPTCVEFCDPDEDMRCDASFSCFPHSAGRETFGLCRPGCSPLRNDCPNEQACVPEKDGFECAQGEGEGEGEGGEPCNVTANCAPGFACVSPGSPERTETPGYCTPFCSVAQDECDEELFCDEILFEVGACVPLD